MIYMSQRIFQIPSCDLKSCYRITERMLWMSLAASTRRHRILDVSAYNQRRPRIRPILHEYKRDADAREKNTIQIKILQSPTSRDKISFSNSISHQFPMDFFSQPSLAQLAQILEAAQPEPKLYSEYNGCKPVHCLKPQGVRSFMPAFDVRELDEGYYLDGDLPGADQRNIEIEFSDPHTLVIKGHTDRVYNNDTNAVPSRSPSPATSATSAGWHQATVEDEDENSNSVSTARTPDTAASEPVEKDQPHFWAKERSIGDFQRTFNFTARVDQDSVRASLKNGVLSVYVPKQPVALPKKIRIQ